MDLFTARDGG